MEDFIANELGTYGPWAVFLLLVMPLMGEDVIIIPAGFLVGQGHLGFWSTFAAAYTGALISDAMWYFVCYYYGTPLLHKRWFKRLAHPRRLLQAKHQIEKRGAWLIIIARFIPGSRTSVVIMSGLLHMPAWKFLLAECSCLVVTVAMQLGAGMLLAHKIGKASTVGKIMTIIGVVLLLTLGAFALNWWSQHRRTNRRAPRSKAHWLRRFRVRRPGAQREPGTLRIPGPTSKASGNARP